MAKLLAMMLLSASLSGAQAAPGTEQIVIGASLPLTGSEAKAGARVRDGYQLAVDEVMRAGGLKVGNRRLPIRLELLDDATDKQRAAQLVGELVQKRHANFLLGSFTSPLVEAQAAAADRLQVPYVAASGSAISIYQRGYRYVFSLSAPTGQMGNSLMRFVDDQQRDGARGPEKEARETLPHGGTDYVLSAVWWNAQLTSNPLSKAFVEAFIPASPRTRRGSSRTRAVAGRRRAARSNRPRIHDRFRRQGASPCT
jgi:hypothetical protein